MSRLSVSFDYLRCLTANDRNRADSDESLTSPCAASWIALYIKTRRNQYAGLLSVTSLFGRLPRRFKDLFRSTGSILRDDSNKTFVRPTASHQGRAIAAKSAPRRMTPTQPSPVCWRTP